MKLSEYQKIRGVRGFWSWLTVFCTTKEFMFVCILVFIAWIATLIINPSMAMVIRTRIAGLIP